MTNDIVDELAELATEGKVEAARIRLDAHLACFRGSGQIASERTRIAAALRDKAPDLDESIIDAIMTP